MLNLPIEETELYDDELEEFVVIKPIVLHLEHSLVSISKWESKWRKPFLDPHAQRTLQENRDYVQCMTMNQHVDPAVYFALTNQDYQAVADYINSSQTATWFSNNNSGAPSREIVTSELLYFQMVNFGIPFECQKWHLSRLLALIRICAIKNSPESKMSHAEILNANRKLNEARRKAARSRG